MESVKTKVIYVDQTKVQKIEEAFESKHVFGSGPEAVFTKHSLGWFALFEGSHEAIYLGDSEPRLKSGDNVKVTFERID